MRVRKWAVMAGAIALATLLVGQVVEQRTIRAQRQDLRARQQKKQDLFCQQQKEKADAKSFVVHDSQGREVAAGEGMIQEISLQASRLVATRLNDDCKQTSVPYDFSGEAIASFPPDEQVRNFVLNDPPRILTSTSGVETRSALYSLSGEQVASFTGRITELDADSQRVLSESAGENSYIYDLSGDEIAVLSGESPKFVDGGRLIATYDRDNQRGYLYNLSGDEMVTVTGSIRQVFEPLDRSDRLLLTEASAVIGPRSYLYTISGEEIASLDGIYASLVDISGEQYIKTYDAGGSSYSALHNLSGELVTTFKGISADYTLENDRIVSNRDRGSRDFGTFQYDLYLQDFAGNEIAFFEEAVDRYSFTRDGRQLIVSFADERTVIYDLQGEEITTIEGSFKGFAGGGQAFFVSSEDGRTRLYNPPGNVVTTFGGTFSEVSEDGKFVVTVNHSEDTTYLYDSSGSLLSQHEGTITNFKDSAYFYPSGLFVANQYLITATKGGTTHLWLLDDEAT
ncbi:MAG: hypothetical protein AAFZ17_04075 [Cyanobacteria bacterium J06650_10]